MRYALLLTAALTAATATAQLAGPGAVAWYPMEGNAQDFSGNENHGSVTGAALVAGRIGTAYSFNGTSDYIEVPHNASLAGWDDFAITFWLNSEQAKNTAHNPIVCKFKPSGNQRGWSITSAPTTGNLTFLWSPNGTATTALTLHAYDNVFDGTWHHVAFSRTGTTLSYYLDGVLITAPTLSGTGFATNARVIVAGQDGATVGSFFDGTVDDIRLYNRALSETDIRRVMLGFQPLGATP